MSLKINQIISHPALLSYDDSEDDDFYKLNTPFVKVYMDDLNDYVTIFKTNNHDLFFHIVNTSQREDATIINNKIYICDKKGIIKNEERKSINNGKL